MAAEPAQRWPLDTVAWYLVMYAAELYAPLPALPVADWPLVDHAAASPRPAAASPRPAAARTALPRTWQDTMRPRPAAKRWAGPAAMQPFTSGAQASLLAAQLSCAATVIQRTSQAYLI